MHWTGEKNNNLVGVFCLPLLLSATPFFHLLTFCYKLNSVYCKLHILLNCIQTLLNFYVTSHFLYFDCYLNLNVRNLFHASDKYRLLIFCVFVSIIICDIIVTVISSFSDIYAVCK